MEILIPIFFFSCVALVIKWVLEHSRWKREFDRGASTDNSLRTSELKRLMREAVEEANEPLVARVEAIEARLNAPGMPPLQTTERLLLDESLEEPNLAAEAPARLQRVT